MGDGTDVVKFSETKHEVETRKATAEEALRLFDPVQIASYRKTFNGRFKPAPKPTFVQRVVNWFRRVFA